MHFDLIIIGIGLTGLMAAKTAVEEGRRVLLVGRGAGSLCIFTNSIDVLAAGGDGNIKESVSLWIKGHPHHPYAKAGWDSLEASLASFTALFPPDDSFTSREGKNSLIPTGAGTRRSTYLMPESILAGAGARMEKTLIVGIEGFEDFHAEYVAHHLKCRGITVTIPWETGNVTNATGLASLMDNPSFCGELAGLIRKRLAGEEFIGLPALLGLRSSRRAREIIETGTGCQVFEIPILPPSIPGMRIFHLFQEYLTRRGAAIIQGHRVESSLRKGKRCSGINVAHPPLTKTYTADGYILATGRFFSGGLQTDENRIYEPIFDLPILQPPARRDWFQRRFFAPEPHPIHGAGILTDHQLRPVDQEGNLLWDNLRVAGSILTHHDSTKELSREGIALATGYAAAKWTGRR